MSRNRAIDFNSFFAGEQWFGAVGMQNFSTTLARPVCFADKVAAYHVFLPGPCCVTEDGETFGLAEFELLTAELSARLWKLYNGSVYMITDSVGAEYFCDKHFDLVYDEILPVLDARYYGIDRKKYWASAKVQALTKIKAPCAIMDLDMIIWKTLDLRGCDLAASHLEHLNNWLYPDVSFFIMSPRYSFPETWDYSAEPLNTSFVYFADDTLKDYYARQSIRFMQYERDTPNDGFSCMIYAEQRILAMCAKEKKAKVKLFLDYDDLMAGREMMTHIWSAKRFLRMENTVREKYIRLCRSKIEEVKALSPCW